MLYQKIQDPTERVPAGMLHRQRTAPCQQHSEQTIRFMLRLIETHPQQYRAMLARMIPAERAPLQAVLRDRLVRELTSEMPSGKEYTDV